MAIDSMVGAKWPCLWTECHFYNLSFGSGSTSSGKSTLLNALLGTSVLPTSHNAATSALCEIKYSSSGKKLAILHIQEGKNRKKEEVDLTSQEGFKLFSKLIGDRSRGRRQSAGLSRSLSAGSQKLALSASVTSLPTQLPEPEPVCVKAEIYWPLEFLKVLQCQSMDSVEC